MSEKNPLDSLLNSLPNMQSLSEPMVKSDSASEDEVINSTDSVEYNIHSASDSSIDSDYNESDSAQMLLPLETLTVH